MAELPQIQSGRVQLAGAPSAVTPGINMPQVEYTGLKAGAQYQNNVSATLDQLSQRLFGMASDYAKQAGMQYVADNPISDEQMNAAINGDVSTLKLGGSFNVFDQAVRKARAFEVSASMEAEARNELTTLLTKMEAGDKTVTTKSVQEKINNMMTGYSKSLAQVDPEASLKFRATISTTGNTILAKAAELEIKRAKQERLIKFDQDFDNTLRLLEPAISQGFWVDDKGNTRSVEELANIARSSISTSSVLLGDATVQKTYSDKFEARWKEAKINVVSKFVSDPEFSANPDAGLAMLRSGNAGKLSNIFAAMDYTDQSKVMANYMIAMNQRDAVKKSKSDALKIEGEQQFTKLYIQAATMTDTDPRRKGIYASISKIAVDYPGSVPLSILTSLGKPSEGGNQMVEFNVRDQIYSGKITTSEQIMKVEGLLPKQKVEMIALLHSETKSADAELARGINKLAGIPSIPGQTVVLDPKGEAFKSSVALTKQADSIRASAAAAGKPITNSEILKQLSDDLEKKRNNNTYQSAKNSLTKAAEKFGMETISRDDLPAMRQKYKGNLAKTREIDAIERYIKQMEDAEK